MKNINKNTVSAISFLVVAVILSVVSFFLLPDTVVTQISASGNNNTMPKFLAILIPLIISVAGAVWQIVSRNDDAGKSKPVILSSVGLFVFVLMLIVNVL